MDNDYIKLKDIKPVLTGYIRQAAILLHRSPSPDEKAVHDIRVLMKKSRAVLRLITSQIDAEYYEREYNSFREVGRIMSVWRETSVHRKTLKDLKRKNKELFNQLSGNQKIENLMLKNEIITEPGKEVSDRVELIGEHLSKAGYRLRFQTMSSLDPKSLIKELDSTYQSVVGSYVACRHNPKQENIHLFRKRAKDLLYQLWFFRPINPAAIKNLERRLDSLTQNLGKHNDLSVLLKTLEYKYTGPGTGSDHTMDKLAVIIRTEQDRYLSRVWPAAFKLFCPGQNIINLLGFRILML